MKITDDHINEFKENGAVLLKGAFSEYVDSARMAIEENIEKPSWRERTYRPDDDGQAFFRIMLYGTNLMVIEIWLKIQQCLK